MTEFLVYLMWLMGGYPPADEPSYPNDPVVTTQGGGIPVGPGKVDDAVN